ncbi:TetR family transcriptional regulator [Shimia isoporae]|uniref:TetR family transcriptional regulator n=2 Tax=Shimia isoporae TaxID=647720 RepID=A0A4R1NMK6_9RHOB|nr:TetR family transcriptional regulator [Shimia isoporae]
MTSDPRKNYIEIATRLFAQDGFDGVSLAVLAREASVSKQAVLHFFGTKERLYAEVLSALCDRLCAEIETARAEDARTHLAAYYRAIVTSVLESSQDIRLVMRALLDSDPKARSWPLTPYLDRLIDLVRALPNQSGLSRPAALAEAHSFIGSVQYVVISLPTVEGIYGMDTREALAEFILESAEHEIARLCKNSEC